MATLQHGLHPSCASVMMLAAVAEGTGPGLEAQEYMDAGKLVPDEVVVTIDSCVAKSVWSRRKRGMASVFGPNEINCQLFWQLGNTSIFSLFFRFFNASSDIFCKEQCLMF